MRIAIPFEKGQIFQHFGHTERFKIYDVEDGAVTVTTTINTDGSGHGALADILKKIHVDTLICGNIGDGARRALTEAGIEYYCGITGSVDQAVDTLLKGHLVSNPDAHCDHEGHHHGGGHHHHEGQHHSDRHGRAKHACKE